MKYFPFFIDIEDKPGLIVGGGKVAEEKVFRLQPFHSNITVIAPDISEKLMRDKDICCIKREFQDTDINNKLYVIAATNNQKLNEYISNLCKNQGIFVNVVDNINQCGFIFPSLVTSGSLCIGISTGGASPSVASIYRKKIQKQIPENMEEILIQLAECRKWAKENIQDNEARKRYLKEQAEKFFNSYLYE